MECFPEQQVLVFKARESKRDRGLTLQIECFDLELSRLRQKESGPRW